jgi:A/G-specific adenine glycosylase
LTELADWYVRHGRHDLPWRASRDRWRVLVSEVMLHQTQVPRVAAAWPAFIGRFPTPESMAGAGAGAVIEAWGRLGYPRRARRLWEAAVVITDRGWPDDLETLPGVGRYTARAVAAQVDGADVGAIEVNTRRVVERSAGAVLTTAAAESAMRALAPELDGRDRLLAVMDVGALLCRPRNPRCDECPLRTRCLTKGVLADREPRRQARYEGSFRQRRGRVLASLREHDTVELSTLDPEALASLVADGLAAISDGAAHLP